MLEINVKHLLSIGLFISLGACSFSTQETLPFFNSAGFTPEWISKDMPRYPTIHTIPSFSLVDQEGDTISEVFIQGKIVVADFFFTACPGICPRLTKNMRIIQDQFKDDESILLLSHSVTPDIDSIPRLKAYAEQNHIDRHRWHLLTGDRKEIYTLARLGYFADEETGLKKNENDFLHTENFILLDYARRIRGVYNGTNPAEIERLLADIKVLKLEMAHEKS